MDWIQQWQSKLNKQNGVAPLVRTGGSRHTGLAALPYRNIHLIFGQYKPVYIKFLLYHPIFGHLSEITYIIFFYYFREKDTKSSENITTDDKKKSLL